MAKRRGMKKRIPVLDGPNTSFTGPGDPNLAAWARITEQDIRRAKAIWKSVGNPFNSLLDAENARAEE